MIALFYLALAFLGLASAAVAFFRTERRAELGMVFVLSSALVTLFDWVAFGWFDLYEYHPGLAADVVVDVALGEVLADMVGMPALVIFLVRFLPGWPGVLLGALGVTALEIWFLQVGIFQHKGWQTWATTAGFLFYFAGFDLFWRDLQRREIEPSVLRGVLRWCLLFLAFATLALYLRAIRGVYTNLHVMPTYMGNQSLGRFVWYGIFVPGLGWWTLAARGAARWWRLGSVLAGLALAIWGLAYIDLQYIVWPWTVLLDLLSTGGLILIAGLLEDLLMAASRQQHLARV